MGTKDIRLFTVKSGLFLLAVIALQIGIVSAFGSYFIPGEIANLDAALAKRPEILLLSDSTNCVGDSTDVSKKCISEMLQEELPMNSVGQVSRQGNHADLYLEYCRNIIRHEHKPKMVVMTINLRSFSPAVDQRPDFQFEKEKYFLQHDSLSMRAIYRILAVFRVIDLNTITRGSYLQTPVYEGERYAGQIKDFDSPYYYGEATAEKTRNKMVLHYMYRLSASTRKVQSMIKTAELLKNNGIIPLFYISPCQYEAGDTYVGPHFSQNVARNTSLVSALLAMRGAALIDLSRTIPTWAFIEGKLYPDNHMKTSGRTFVAKEVAKFIKSGYLTQGNTTKTN